MCGQCPRSARAKKRCDHAHSRPTLYHGVPRIFLTAPLSYAAVAFHLGPCEKLLRYVKLATSCLNILVLPGFLVDLATGTWQKFPDQMMAPMVPISAARR
jgi:hypothetical protein